VSIFSVWCSGAASDVFSDDYYHDTDDDVRTIPTSTFLAVDWTAVEGRAENLRTFYSLRTKFDDVIPLWPEVIG